MFAVGASLGVVVGIVVGSVVAMRLGEEAVGVVRGWFDRMSGPRQSRQLRTAASVVTASAGARLRLCARSPSQRRGSSMTKTVPARWPRHVRQRATIERRAHGRR